MIHYANAENYGEIARLLRSRGRIVVTGPSRCGKTTELIRYAEERYPNGRFAVVCRNEAAGEYITRLHWCIYNGISFVEVCAKRLLGEKLEGEEVNAPTLLTPTTACYRVFNPSTPVFVDEWFSLPQDTQRVILKRRLFIASTTSPRENTHASSQEDQDGQEGKLFTHPRTGRSG